MRKLRIILIGLGKQAVKDHIPAVLRRNDIEIVAVVDANENLSKEVGENLRVNHFTDINEAITAASPNLAIVCVPHTTHILEYSSY